jgi:hypothetical protein
MSDFDWKVETDWKQNMESRKPIGNKTWKASHRVLNWKSTPNPNPPAGNITRDFDYK